MKPPVLEFSLSLMCYWWAVVFFSSPTILYNLPIFFEPIGKYTVPAFWGAFFIGVGLCFTLGFILELCFLRKVGLLISTFIFALIAAGYYIGAGANSIGFGIFAVISYMALFALRGVGQDE